MCPLFSLTFLYIRFVVGKISSWTDLRVEGGLFWNSEFVRLALLTIVVDGSVPVRFTEPLITKDLKTVFSTRVACVRFDTEFNGWTRLVRFRFLCSWCKVSLRV